MLWAIICSDQLDFSEGMCIPRKRPASEEAISRGLSNLNISPPSEVKYSEMEMVSIDEPSDESDDECGDEKGYVVPIGALATQNPSSWFSVSVS